MLDEIIETMKEKPEIKKDEPKVFKVVYDDIDLPLEEPIQEFNFGLFQGKLISNNLEQVVVDKSVKKRESREFIEEQVRREKEEREDIEGREEKEEREKREEKEGREVKGCQERCQICEWRD